MNNNLVSIAYMNFERIFHPHQTGVGMYFWNFIGRATAPRGLIADPNNTDAWEDWTDAWEDWVGFSEKEKRIIRALASPHCEAIAKMLVQQGHDPYKECYYASMEADRKS